MLPGEPLDEGEERFWGGKGSGTGLGQLPSGVRPILHHIEMQTSHPGMMQLFGCSCTILSVMGWATTASKPGCEGCTGRSCPSCIRLPPGGHWQPLQLQQLITSQPKLHQLHVCKRRDSCLCVCFTQKLKTLLQFFPLLFTKE